jgi:P22 coat protein - gene protein 5
MANNFAPSTLITSAALPILKNMLAMAANVNTDWQDEFQKGLSAGYAPGQTIQIKKPPRYTVRQGRVAVPQGTIDTTTPLTLGMFGVDVNVNDFDATLFLPEGQGRLQTKLAAMLAPIANEIDRLGCQLARTSVWNTIGVPGTLPNTQATALDAVLAMQERLDNMSAPRKDMNRNLIMNPTFNRSMITGFAGLFNNTKKVSAQYDSGVFVESLGLSPYMDQNVDVHTNGTQASVGMTVNGGGQAGGFTPAANGQPGGAPLATQTMAIAATTGTLTRGSKITIGGIFFVNAQSRTSNNVPVQVVLTQDVAAGATAITFSPALIVSGPFQNVTAAPANGATLTVFGAAGASYACNFLFHKDAFTFASVPLLAPPSGRGVVSETKSYEGLTISWTEGYDIINRNLISRMDVLCGFAPTYPELACIYAV